jgi:hypothetical protein
MVRTDGDGTLHRVDCIRVIWSIDIGPRESVELEHGAMQGAAFAFGTVTHPDGTSLVIVQPADGGPDDQGST